MRKTSNSSSTNSELETLDIEITTDVQNNKTKNITKHETIGIIPSKPQIPLPKIPLPQMSNNQIPNNQIPNIQIPNNQIHLPQMQAQYAPQYTQNNNPHLPPQNMARIIYPNTEITQINNNIQILDQNDKIVLKKIKSYEERNDYLLASLILTIGILSCCNPILLTVGVCMIPDSTSDRQRGIMHWMKISMVISWILLAIEIIICLIGLTIV